MCSPCFKLVIVIINWRRSSIAENYCWALLSFLSQSLPPHCQDFTLLSYNFYNNYDIISFLKWRGNGGCRRLGMGLHRRCASAVMMWQIQIKNRHNSKTKRDRILWLQFWNQRIKLRRIQKKSVLRMMGGVEGSRRFVFLIIILCQNQLRIFISP